MSASRLQHIVISTGAGISAESGLGTFRDAGGIWSQYDLSEVATPEGYAKNPDLVLSFYNARRAHAVAATPNAAHRALVALERAWRGAGRQLTLITQNVDGLHEAAGASEVVHMHGALARALCGYCGHQWDWTGEMSREEDVCPNCTAKGGVRPDVVWFGEIPYHLEEIGDALATADLYVSIGSSGAVYPAAGFATEARHNGARTLELNLERSEITPLFHETRLGPASTLVPIWVEEMIATL
ncbi:MAG: NAD-dependent deacylase [Pseudomonadota bacterium]